MSRLVYLAGGASQQGSARATNQDAFLLLPLHGVFAVADGISGKPAGDVASLLVIEGIRDAFVNENATWPDGIPTDHGDRLRKALLLASRRVTSAQEKQGLDMGSTVAAVLIGRHHATIGHMGDSRVLLLRDGALTLLTRDHTSVPRMIALGVDPTIANVIGSGLDRWAGKITAMPEIRVEKLARGDALILVTDGITSVLDEGAMVRLLVEQEEPQSAAEQLLACAVSAGGRDDMTAVVLRFETYPEEEKPS